MNLLTLFLFYFYFVRSNFNFGDRYRNMATYVDDCDSLLTHVADEFRASIRLSQSYKKF